MKSIVYFITIFCSIIAISCGSSDEPGNKQEPKRTVLVYMVADNTLGNTYDTQDLKEMTEAVSKDCLNGGRLIVYHSRPGTNRGNAPQLLDITKDGIVTLKDYPDDPSIYSVSPERIGEVIADTKRLAPADDYGLVLWSHANGWIEYADDFRARSFGDDRSRHITIGGLASALEGTYFSFIYFDCCLMGNIEVAYEFRHLTPQIVASPTELSVSGMPYNLNVPEFFAVGTPNMLLAAQNTYDWYASGQNGDNRCQMVVINTEPIDRLAAATRDIFMKLDDYPADAQGIQGYGYDTKCWSYDMKDYIEKIAAGHPLLLNAWLTEFNSTIAAAHTTPNAMRVSKYPNTFPINSYSGLGTFVILGSDDISYRGYKNCSWYKDVVSVAPAYNK